MEKVKASKIIPSSFRDPSGFVFHRDGSVYRQVNIIYKENYDHLVNSGLYEELVDAELLIPHDEVQIDPASPDKSYKIIKPELIPFISYPYEWCFNQLRDAALTTLEIQKKSLNFGMSLKDCSAYNVQFIGYKPVFIDTLSFEKKHQEQPWVAYKQFCQQFIAPLALMSYRDVRLNQLLRTYIDGIPLDLASSLLPFSTFFNFALACHIHLHAKSQKYFADKTVNTSNYKMGHLSSFGLLDSLGVAIKKLKCRAKRSEWVDYYKNTNYSAEAFQHKKQIVAEFLDEINPKTVWDLGANVGMFSRIASDRGIQTISFDIDPGAVQNNYLECVKKHEINILPLLLDLTNPSSDIGWENQERMSLLKRGPADTVFALGLVHHLAISNNLPLNKIADFFNKICNSLIIEFIPKSDSQAQKLLSAREDIFLGYTQQAFQSKFREHFIVRRFAEIKGSQRTLYLMVRR